MFSTGESKQAAPRIRVAIEIGGAVQGVGFRPFVYRLARELELGGNVSNDSRGVRIELEGTARALERFQERLAAEAPRLARIQGVRVREMDRVGDREFAIVDSEEGGRPRAEVLADVATCPACLAELFDPHDRRAGYPFTNCTDCGPRFTIVRSLPYDRGRTTMAAFEMCERCRAEYEDPADRRFHAQPNACPECGPRIWLQEAGRPVDGDPIEQTVARLRSGQVCALKGIGGFLLLVDASDSGAVARLRWRKGRPTKPLALLATSVEQVERIARCDASERDLLESPEAPIVLLRRRPDAEIAPEVAPGTPWIGVMLPTTPLHSLISTAFGAPLVATSGNLSDEPIATDNDEAVHRLRGIADFLLLHDRPIARHVDDSVVRVVGGGRQFLRRARGYAPRPVRLRAPQADVLAVGGHFKNSVALAVEDSVFLSQHIGDMETPEALAAFEAVIVDFLDLYRASPVAIAQDLHPDYASSQWAARAIEGREANGALTGLPRVRVQHHHGHLVSGLAEHQADGPALGIVWDGTGLGTDGTIWGGEFLLGDARGYRRVGRLRPFSLPGAEAAAREPIRSAVGLLHAAGLDDEITLAGLAGLRELPPSRLDLLQQMLHADFGCARTSSCGRLFDGVAALLGAGDRVSFEGEAAIRLENLASDRRHGDRYRMPLRTVPPPDCPAAESVGEAVASELIEVDWTPVIEAIVADLGAGRDPAAIAGDFHGALVDAALELSDRIEAPRVVLSGGCLQNLRLSEGLTAGLQERGREPLVHRRVPPNDGGLGLGQAVVAGARLA